MPASFAVKSAAFVAFLILVGGATFAVQQSLGGSDVVNAGAFRLSAARSTLNATIGHSITYDVIVSNQGDKAQDVAVTISGEGVTAGTGTARVPAGGNMTAFVPIGISTTLTPGTYPLHVRMTSTDGKLMRERADLLKVRILPTTRGFDDNSTVNLLYTGRLASNGKVFNSNDPQLLALNFPKSDQYRASAGALPVVGSPEPQVVLGFYRALHGIQAGESRTVTIAAVDAYGNATTDSTVPRTETIDRDFTLPVRIETVARATFDSYMNDTDQTGPFQPGKVFFFVQGPNHWPYRITSYSADSVGYEVAVETGQTYTLYPFWANASIVARANATEVVFRTTPTTGIGDPFTMRSYWPGMTAVDALNDTAIVVKHSPPVGFKYTQPATQLQQESDVTVRSVSDTEIVVATPSTNPLAGQDLVFDIMALDLTR
ncbi:MAG: FKBP-type peptidyl-prolyl cis-trans isomerase [Candidatus Thermoplasmatota archaeon]